MADCKGSGQAPASVRFVRTLCGAPAPYISAKGQRMAILGFILLLLGIAAAAFGLWVAMSTDATTTSVAAFGNTFDIAPMTMLLLGAVAILLLLLGIWMMTAAGRRKVRSTQERRDLEKRQREQEKELSETRNRLAAEETRRDTPTTSMGSPRVETESHDLGRDTNRDTGATRAQNPRDPR